MGSQNQKEWQNFLSAIRISDARTFAWTPEARLAWSMLKHTRQDYARPFAAIRKQIDAWMAGAQATWMFEDVCGLLPIKSEYLKEFIRGERGYLVAGNKKEPANGSLATHRKRRNGAGHTGPERLLSGQGSVDRVEGGEQPTEQVAEKLGESAAEGGRQGVGDEAIGPEHCEYLWALANVLLPKSVALGPDTEAAV